MGFYIQDNGFDPDAIAHLGNQYLIGNGYMGVRGTLEEYGKDELAAVNLSGIYDRHGAGWREPLNAPNGLYTYVCMDDTVYRLPQSEPLFHRQGLDFRHGIHARHTSWRTGKGTLTVTGERFASMASPHLICLRYTVKTDFIGEIVLATGIDGDVWDIHGPHYTAVELNAQNRMLTALATANEGKQVAVCAAVCPGFDAAFHIMSAEKAILRKLYIHARPREGYTLYKYIAVYTSQDDGDPLGAALACAQGAGEAGYDTLIKSHAAAWEALWDVSKVVIEGDDAANDALNYSIYHLHCIAPRPFASRSIPARGLSGQTYKGAVFWDTEMFMLDFFLHTEPLVARTLLRYRIDTLPGARQKAREYGYEGAFYAWESQEGGYEACSEYNVTDVFTGRPMRTYFREKQVHISSAVAHGLMRYIDYTGDTGILPEGGAETLIECARFYLSLLVKRVMGECYEIRDVIGPDEYHERVDNNAYTNRMAKLTLDAAVEAIEIVRQKYQDAYEAMDRKYGLAELMEAFRDAAARLYIPGPDEDGVIEQFTGYFGLEDASVGEVRGRLLDPREYWGGAYGVASHTRVIKQADVVTMLWLFKDEYSTDMLRANWEYYEPRTEHGSSLSACMYAMVACRFARPDLAYPFFQMTASADLRGGGKEWAGLTYIGGTHPAAAGGAWMTAVQGFAGLRITDGHITVDPHLPERWSRLRFRIRLYGDVYEIDIAKDGYRIDMID